MSLLAPLVFTAEDEQRLRKVFDRLDHDKKGYITPLNIKELCQELGHEFPPGKAEELLAKCDPNKVGKVTWETFVKGCSVVVPKLIAAVALIGAFRALDAEDTGYIAKADLEQLIAEYEVPIEKARVNELILKTNPGADGRIEYKQFTAALVAHLRSL